MPDLFLLFSHTITPIQEEQAYMELGVGSIIEPPLEIRKIWSAIPPADDALMPFLPPVFSWLEQNAESGDFVLIQGDFGATYLLVRHALTRGYIPVYSTTEREAVETRLEDEGRQVTHTFRHVFFRRYGQ